MGAFYVPEISFIFKKGASVSILIFLPQVSVHKMHFTWKYGWN